MKLQNIAMLSSALFAITGCSDDNDTSGPTDVFTKFLASIEYQDDKLKMCVETAVAEQEIQKSSDLLTFTCSDAIESVTGLAHFKGLQSIDLSSSGLSCAMLNEFDQQLIIDAAALGDDTAAVTVQPEACFYNYLEFADQEFRNCVVEQFTINGWADVSEVTSLTCENPAILSMSGVEQFVNLTDLNLADTSVNCSSAAEFVAGNETVTLTPPAVCVIENIDMSDDVASCVAAQAPESGLVVDLKTLRCGSPEFTDVKGLEKLTSLEELILTDTSVDCYVNRDFEALLLETVNYSKPSACILNQETLIADVIRATGPQDPIFADSILQSCFDFYQEANQWTMVGEVTTLACSSANFKAIASFQGAENFMELNLFHANKPAITSEQDLRYLADLEQLTDVNFQFAIPLKDKGKEVVEYMAREMPQLQNLNLNGFKKINMADFNIFDTEESDTDGIKLLKLTGSQLTDEHVTALSNINSLVELHIGNNPSITTVLPLNVLPNLSTLHIGHKNTANIKCSDIDTLTGNGIEVITTGFTCVP